MTFDSFQSDQIIKPADFRIGGKQVRGASLDFSDVSQEQLILAGVKKILIEYQNQCKSRFMIKGVKNEHYDADIQELADELSGTEIDMAEFGSKFKSWDFTQREGGSKLDKAAKLAKSMTPEEQEELKKYLSSL